VNGLHSKSSAGGIRIGLIGCGRIAAVHLRHLQRVAGVQVAALCDLDRERARALGEQFDVATVVRELDELLRMPLDAVHVLTPPTSHAEAAVAALERGMHVLVEKPMATTRQAAERMCAAAAASGRLLCVDHNRLFDPVIAEARDRVASGEIGTLLSVEASQGVNVQEGGPAAAPLAMWLNLGPHPLYLLRDFIGGITDWHVVGGPLGELRAVLKGSRALGYLCFSPGATPYLNGLVLHGTRATLQIDLNTMALIRRRERSLPKMVAKAALNVDLGVQLLASTARTTIQVATGRMGTYPGIGVVIRRFYEAVAGAGELPVTPADGLAVVELLENLWAQTHRAPTLAAAPRRAAAPGRERTARGLVVLVTGASGFLGRHVVSELAARGARPRALVRAVPPDCEEQDGVEFVVGTLGDDAAIARAVAGAQAVVHCAARVARRGTRADFFRDNVAGTAHLLEAARAAGVERFVHVSSIAVYDWQTGNEPVRVDTPYDPHPERRGAYTWSKLEADRLVREFERRGGLRTIVLRPGILVGPGGPPFTARLRIGPIAGRVLIVGRRTARLPLSRVEDVGRAAASAVFAPGAHGAYNLVDDRWSQEAWLRAEDRADGALRPLYVPPWLAMAPALCLELMARVARRPAPALSRYRIRRATESLGYDTARAEADLGWAPTAGPAGAGVERRAATPGTTGGALAPPAILGELRR
jgi:predicted dehydrogenase/nucleoside-diphosphate-sugar epimerase